MIVNLIKKTRRLVKKMSSEKVLFFLRLDNYRNILFYSSWFLKRIFSFSFSPFSGLQQSIPIVDSPSMFREKLDGFDLEQQLLDNGYYHQAGRHAIYINVETILEEILLLLGRKYYNNVGLKIVKSLEMAQDGTPYYTSRKNAHGSNWLSMMAVGSLREKVIISNILSMQGVAPRVYDVIRLNIFGTEFFALIVENVGGGTIGGDGADEFMVKFYSFLNSLDIKIVARKNNKDFKSPDYNSNILSSDNQPKYIDIQNFATFPPLIPTYPCGWINHLPPETSRYNVIWGKKISKILSTLTFRAKLRKKFCDFDIIFEMCSFSPEEKIIMDYGVNEALFTVWALNRGARWAYILSDQTEVDSLQRFLFGTGFTRFELITTSSETSVQINDSSIDLLYLGERDLLDLDKLNASLQVNYIAFDTKISDGASVPEEFSCKIGLYSRIAKSGAAGVHGNCKVLALYRRIKSVR